MPQRPALTPLFAASLASFFVLPLVGCAPGADPEADEQIGIYGQPIKGGYTDTTDTGAVGIYDASIGAICTGSLIAPNVVLTARHCVSNTSETVQCGQAKPGTFHPAKYFYVTTKANLNSQNPADYHTVREVIGLPLDAASSDPLLNKEDLCGRDQAILILNENIEPAEAVPYLPRVDSEIVKDEQYYAVGFGATDDQGSGAGYRRRRDNLFVTCVSEDCPSTYVKRTEFIGDTGICQGDSGGPALDMQNRVIGVTSRGNFGCDSPVYGYVFGWGQWLKDTVTYASGLGGYTAPPWVSGKSTDPAFGGDVGGKCDAPECTAHYCLNTGTSLGEYCTRKCDAINTCPDGFECNADLGLCTDLPDPKPEPEPDPNNNGNGNGDGSGDGDAGAEGGCAVGRIDPTKPIPWKTGALVAGAALALALRRRRR